jgi:hypothetical protein
MKAEGFSCQNGTSMVFARFHKPSTLYFVFAPALLTDADGIPNV